MNDGQLTFPQVITKKQVSPFISRCESCKHPTNQEEGVVMVL